MILVDSKWFQWFFGDDTGMSSIAIWMRMTGLGRYSQRRFAYPYDTSDFGRCHRLLRMFPDWDIKRMRRVSPVWRALADAWPELTKLYVRDLPTGRSEELYRRLLVVCRRTGQSTRTTASGALDVALRRR
jgi:hypothetical protein